MKATASHRAEKQPRTTDQELPLTGQCAREPACYVRSRRSPGASKIKQTAQSKLAYFYAALMDQFCAALDSNTFCLQNRPELPFLTASRLKTDYSISVPGKIRHNSMTCRSVWHSAAMPVGQAMKVQPVAANIYADDAAM